MAVKLVAVDMDGTFLDSSKNYDRPRFAAQYRQLKDKGVRFVVASGNQYYQLKSFFPDIASEISFVAENGAYVVSEGQELFYGELPREGVKSVLDTLAALPEGGSFAVCGKNSAYLHRCFPEAEFELLSRHYHRLRRIDDYSEIDDVIFKFAINLPGENGSNTPAAHTRGFVSHLEEALGDMVKPVSSGARWVDLIIPGLHKANGLTMLQQRWGISDAEVVAFGDSGNDFEMVSQAGYGYAMDNAVAPIKQAAKYHAQSNDESGVLNVIDRILEGQHPFN
ncbi:Cof-type HAD-IIB family hydrolase [Niveibacterium sp. SC-1]|uniref:Cof-type HAD-IIB family hydrolase n=1 Tax=Niveibacterium sp. SC-1 TaxID=3135646 RepID=UPI00311E1B25